MFYFRGVTFNIADLLEHAVDTTPDRPAVICAGRQVSFAELDERANRLAHHLAAGGVGPGDHVGLLSKNSVETIEVMFAVYKLRAVAVNMNYRYTHDELVYLATDADLVALLYQRRYTAGVAAMLPHAPAVKQVLVIEDGADGEPPGYPHARYEDALAAAAPERDFAERSPDDIYILYTGGTTGYPKGVLWRQEDVWRALGGGINFVTGEYEPDEWSQARNGQAGGLTRLPVAPMVHGAAQWAAFGSLFSCNTVVFVPDFDPHAVWQHIQEHRVAVLTIVGDAMARPLLDAYESGAYDATSLVSVSSHAALLSQSVKQQFLRLFPNLFLTDAIGSSESGFTGIGVVNADSDHSAGPRVMFGKQAILIDEQDHRVEPVPGATGRIARGGHVPLGYYKDEAKSATIFVQVDGQRYVVPGDWARYEDDGTVTLLGRGSQCVNTGGEKVFPEEVEGALKAHPSVRDALVIGIADERYGQRVAAVVQTADGALDVAAVTGHLRGKLAGYKLPRTWWQAKEIGRTPAGKPDYRWAQDYAADHAPLEGN